MVGFALGTMGYPFCLTLSASIFSKVVGGSSNPVSMRFSMKEFLFKKKYYYLKNISGFLVGNVCY